MKRNSEGKVTIGDKVVSIPRNELALSMFGINPVFDRAEYGEDGWIYIDNKPVKKWFKDCYSPDGSSRGVRIWHPILSDIPTLEARKWRMKERKDRFYHEVWRPLYDLLVKVGEAHAKPTHKFKSEKKWWLYKTYECEDTHHIGFDWVDTPAKPKNVEIGQRYYELDRRIMRYYGYINLFDIVLGLAIHKFLRMEHPPQAAGVSLRLVLNGRNYWYVSGYVGHAIDWVKVNWPESPIIEIVM
jgi:hypothetical protein